MTHNLKNEAVGISLKSNFYDNLRKESIPIDFLEGHIENFFEGGYHLEALKELSKHYPISLHGVGLSLGSMEPPPQKDLKIRKKYLI